jgi:hypothetical protein
MIRATDTAALRTMLHAGEASFAVGVPGIIAEFHWTDGDPLEADDGALALATARGGIRVAPRGNERVHEHRGAPAAHQHEGSAQPAGTWCYWLPEPEARIAPAAGLVELGPDADAIRPADRDDPLFDLGFALGHVRACVRSAEPSLLDTLRRHAGADLLAPGNPAMSAIKSAAPHRVFMTCMTRIEVYQPIPSRARGERTPDGPHTHVLPAFRNQADPLAAQLPAQARAVLTVYPRGN